MTEYHSSLYTGFVYHKRFKPNPHSLRYNVCSFLFDLDELDILDQKISGFGYNRFALFSFWNKDYGPRTGDPLRPYVKQHLEKMHLSQTVGRIKLLCYPRILGYTFNPLSVYFCYDNQDYLMAILYEVHNTFGQSHTYCLPISATRSTSENCSTLLQHHCPKQFFVSPFIDMKTTYHFQIRPPSDALTLVIKEHDSEGLLLSALFKGTQIPFTPYALWPIFQKYPLMTLKVILGIHWEAFQIWRKGNKIVKKPAQPLSQTSIMTSENLE